MAHIEWPLKEEGPCPAIQTEVEEHSALDLD